MFLSVQAPLLKSFESTFFKFIQSKHWEVNKLTFTSGICYNLNCVDDLLIQKSDVQLLAKGINAKVKFLFRTMNNVYHTMSSKLVCLHQSSFPHIVIEQITRKKVLERILVNMTFAFLKS